MTSGDTGLEVRLVAVPASASIVRERLREWLAAHGWPEPALDDVVLAANEAVSNSIEHGYVGREPGDVLVTARVEEGPGGRAVRRVTCGAPAQADGVPVGRTAVRPVRTGPRTRT